MSKPPVGQKQCAYVDEKSKKRCRETFTAIGRRAFCDAHRAGGAGKTAVLYSDQRAVLCRLIQAAEGLGHARAQSIVDEATAEILRRTMALRVQLIKSRHEVQKLKTKLDEGRIAKTEKLGVEDLPEKAQEEEA